MDNFISHSEFWYTRMILFSWTCDSPPTSLSQSNGEYFVRCLMKNLNDDVDVVVVNCNDINDIDDHFVDPLFDYLKKGHKTIIFFSNDNKAKLIKYLGHISGNYDLKIIRCPGENIKSICFDNSSIDSSTVLKIIDESIKLEKKWLVRQVKKTYQKYKEPKRLSSTPLVASGEFNATKILSEPSRYKWIVAIMAESINRAIQLDKPKSFTIVTASLRGAVLAGGVWEILYFVSKLDLHIIDHMGPRYDILEIPSKDDKSIANYCIYVGDFMIGGTEIKVVSSYCNLFGSKLKHAFVIGKYIKESYLGTDIKLYSLVNLQECIADLNYVLG